MNAEQTNIIDLVAQYCDDNNLDFEDVDANSFDVIEGTAMFRVYDENDISVEFIVDENGEIDTFEADSDLNAAQSEIANTICDFVYETVLIRYR